MGGAFARCHPAVNFFYFGVVLAGAMVFTHPLCLLISLGTAFCWSVLLKGRRAVRFALCGMAPLLAVTAVLSPLFSHEGATILMYLPDGNPLTLESIAYGLAAAVMLVTVILWFSCYNEVMTSDKFLYLFGRVIPALSLVLSMVLRFVPRFRVKLQLVRDGQRCLGLGEEKKRLKGAVRALSILITWSLEDAIDTADSMKSRGYGLPGRTAFSLSYFPRMGAGEMSLFHAGAFAVYLLFCATPLILEGREAGLWSSIGSKI